MLLSSYVLFLRKIPQNDIPFYKFEPLFIRNEGIKIELKYGIKWNKG